MILPLRKAGNLLGTPKCMGSIQVSVLTPKVNSLGLGGTDTAGHPVLGLGRREGGRDKDKE